MILYTSYSFEAKAYEEAIELLKGNNKQKAIELMYERLIEAQRNEYEMKLKIEKASSENFGERSDNAQKHMKNEVIMQIYFIMIASYY